MPKNSNVCASATPAATRAAKSGCSTSCEQHGSSRKHAIKLLGDALPKPQGQSPPGPQPQYLPVREVLETVWQHAEQLCGKRLAPALALWLPHYAKPDPPRDH